MGLKARFAFVNASYSIRRTCSRCDRNDLYRARRPPRFMTCLSQTATEVLRHQGLLTQSPRCWLQTHIYIYIHTHTHTHTHTHMHMHCRTSQATCLLPPIHQGLERGKGGAQGTQDRALLGGTHNVPQGPRLHAPPRSSRGSRDQAALGLGGSASTRDPGLTHGAQLLPGGSR